METLHSWLKIMNGLSAIQKVRTNFRVVPHEAGIAL